ncbi:hypothetical protein LTR28_013454, partial [Elasticomyces elasticus]
MVLKFEIFVVKVPLLSLHGIQFKKVDGGTWQYKNMAQTILNELRLCEHVGIAVSGNDAVLAPTRTICSHHLCGAYCYTAVPTGRNCFPEPRSRECAHTSPAAKDRKVLAAYWYRFLSPPSPYLVEAADTQSPADLHPDQFYQVYSSTAKNAACHRGTGPAGVYGAETSECDAPMALINQTFAWIEKELKDSIDFVIWTGDSARHDNDEAIPRSTEQVTRLNQLLVDKIVEVF